MIKLNVDMGNIEEFHIAGTPDILSCEIAEIVGIVYRKILNADEEAGRAFRKVMPHMVSADSPVWDAPDLRGETTVIKIPRKK